MFAASNDCTTVVDTLERAFDFIFLSTIRVENDNRISLSPSGHRPWRSKAPRDEAGGTPACGDSETALNALRTDCSCVLCCFIGPAWKGPVSPSVSTLPQLQRRSHALPQWSGRAQRGVIGPMTHVDREHRSVRLRCAVRHERGCPFRTSASRLSRQCWSRPRRSLWRSGAASLRAWSTSQAATRELSVTPVAVHCEAYSLAIRQPARRRP